MKNESKARFLPGDFFSRKANFFNGEKVETVRTHFLAERKGASENVAPVGIKLRMHALEKISVKNSPSGKHA